MQAVKDFPESQGLFGRSHCMIQQMIRQGGKDYKKEMDLPETFNLLLASNDLPDIIDAFTNFYSLGMDYAVQEELESMIYAVDVLRRNTAAMNQLKQN